MPIRNLKTQIGRLPEQPGVYLYFNAGGDTIYVGKARALRDRVRSYLGAHGVNPKTNALLEEADRLEVIVTDSVVEALAHRLFGIRSCNEVITGKRARPCLEYDINRCLAPCVDTICSETEYQHAVQDTRLFLEGRSDELTEQLRGRMVEAAEAEQYERAGQLRDAMRTVQTLHEQQQKMARAELGDRDVFGLKVGPAGAVLLVFLVRRGRVIERIELVTESEG